MFRMKREYVPFAFLWILIISVFAAQGLAASVNGNFSITPTSPSDGLAFKISDPSATEIASVTLEGSYHSVSAKGNIRLRVTSGSVTIGGNTYAIQNGNGVYNPTSGHIIIIARLNVQPGEKQRNLTLFGYVSSPSSLGGSVTFIKPESKLSGAYFLAINANLALT
jgi:hypothetical protein